MTRSCNIKRYVCLLDFAIRTHRTGDIFCKPPQVHAIFNEWCTVHKCDTAGEQIPYFDEKLTVHTSTLLCYTIEKFHVSLSKYTKLWRHRTKKSCFWRPHNG